MRALSRNTRRVTALTLAAALVVAVYLNWQYARADITPQTEDDTLMVSAEPVDAKQRLPSRMRCPQRRKPSPVPAKTMAKHSLSALQTTAVPAFSNRLVSSGKRHMTKPWTPCKRA